jgi:hypothetical protein
MNFKTIYGWALIVLAVLAEIGDGFQDSTMLLGAVILIASGWIIVDSQAKIKNLEIDVFGLIDENAVLEEQLDDATR